MSFRKDRGARTVRKTSLVRPIMMLRRGLQEKKGVPIRIRPARHDKDIKTDECRKRQVRSQRNVIINEDFVFVGDAG